jgi:hypothetical protein
VNRHHAPQFDTKITALSAVQKTPKFKRKQKRRVSRHHGQVSTHGGEQLKCIYPSPQYDPGAVCTSKPDFAFEAIIKKKEKRSDTVCYPPKT